MVHHGDDIYIYSDIRCNLSSNVYNGFDHSGLYKHLAEVMPCIANYPEPTPAHLEALIAEHLAISSDNVMVTNGATEAIYLIALAFSGSHSHIMQPTFGEYSEACRIHHHKIVENNEADLIWICNPNNPTGKVIPHCQIMQSIHKSADKTIIIDQSYDRFTSCKTLSPAEAIKEPNVLVLHSMTKEYTIPGIRLGYIIANSSLLNKIRQHRMPWSVNSLAIEAGKYLIEHDSEYIIDVDMLSSEKNRMATKLRALGIQVSDSDTHILLCKLPADGIVIDGRTIKTSSDLKLHLATKQAILIRDASNFSHLSPQHFRIAVQDAETNNIFLQALNSKL